MRAAGQTCRRMYAGVTGEFVGSAKGVQAFSEVSLTASEHRRIAQGEAARFRLAQLLEKIEKIGGLIGFERDHEFLIIQPERISCVQLYRSVLRSNAKILFHHFVSLLLWARVPFACALQGTNEKVFGLSGHDMRAIFRMI